VAARLAAGKMGSTVNRHQGRRVGQQKLPPRERRKMKTIEAKTGSLSEESAKHHACPEV